VTHVYTVDFGALFGNFDNFLDFTVGGLVFGAIYALIALGYTMVYGVLQLINFAHSEVAADQLHHSTESVHAGWILSGRRSARDYSERSEQYRGRHRRRLDEL
jgi:hypothetical protein